MTTFLEILRKLEVLRSEYREEAAVRSLARLIAYYGVRNSKLEDLHAEGKIQDQEMRELMLDVESNIAGELSLWVCLGVMIPKTDQFAVADWQFILADGPSYDRKEWAAP